MHWGRVEGHPVSRTGLIANVLIGVVGLAGRTCTAVIILSNAWNHWESSKWTNFWVIYSIKSIISYDTNWTFGITQFSLILLTEFHCCYCVPIWKCNIWVTPGSRVSGVARQPYQKPHQMVLLVFPLALAFLLMDLPLPECLVWGVTRELLKPTDLRQGERKKLHPHCWISSKTNNFLGIQGTPVLWPHIQY